MEHAGEMPMGFIIIGAIVLMVIGFLVGKVVGQNSESNQSAKNAKDELEEYKQKVSEHFGKTADLVDDLTQSYKNVFDHLGDSAHKLLDSESVKKHIESRKDKAITLQYGSKNGVVEMEKTEEPTETVKSEASETSSKLVESKTEQEYVQTSDSSGEQTNEQATENNNSEESTRDLGDGTKEDKEELSTDTAKIDNEEITKNTEENKENDKK